MHSECDLCVDRVLHVGSTTRVRASVALIDTVDPHTAVTGQREPALQVPVTTRIWCSTHGVTLRHHLYNTGFFSK